MTRRTAFRRVRGVGVALSLFTAGCVHAPLNAPLTHYDPRGGFRYTAPPAGPPTLDLAMLDFRTISGCAV